MTYHRTRRWEKPHPAFLSVFILLLVLFYIPIGGVLIRGFFPDSRFDLRIFRDTITSAYTLRIIWFTFTQAVLSTLFSLLLGLPGAFLLATYSFPGKRLVRALSGIPFVLPPILVVLGFVIFFGNSGLLNSLLMRIFDLEEPPLRILYSLGAIILAHGFYNFPIVLRVVSSLWQQLPPSQEWAARTLGARKFRLFCSITLPQLLPAVLSSAALVFMFCFTSFAVILVLGGGPEYTTIEVEIYRLARTSLDISAAGALSSAALIITLGLMYVYIQLQNRLSFHQELTVHQAHRRSFQRPGPAGLTGIIVYISIMLVIAAGPILGVVFRSFQKPSSRAGSVLYTFEWYRRMFFDGAGQFGRIALPAIRNSLLIGTAAAAAAILIGTAISYVTVRYRFRLSSLIDTLSMAPMAVSSVILGLGYFLLLRSMPDFRNGAVVMVIAAHSIIAYPFVVRTVSSVLKKLSPNQLYAAMLLGAPPRRVFRTVELPVLLPSLGAASIFAFAISLGEINATLLFSSSVITIPLAIYRMIGSYNFFGACALGTLLILVCTGVFALFDYAGDSDY